MRFALTGEQADFAATLDRLLTGADTVAAARAWGEGDAGPGLALWKRLADQGINGLLVPEEQGGMGATPVELVVAFEALGRHAVPGPWVESAAYLPLALPPDRLEELAAGLVATVAVPPLTPYAVDAHTASAVYVADGGTLAHAEAGEPVESLDPTRRLHRVVQGEQVEAGDLDAAFDHAALATAAELLGAGERLLADSVAYVQQRTQFGRAIGSYQAIKHRLADVRIGLDFARPLVFGAALGMGTADRGRDVSAAKVAAGDAAYAAARAALQVHGAIGYTREFDLSVWLLRVRALHGAWGTAAWHRARVLTALESGRR